MRAKYKVRRRRDWVFPRPISKAYWPRTINEIELWRVGVKAGRFVGLPEERKSVCPG